MKNNKKFSNTRHQRLETSLLSNIMYKNLKLYQLSTPQHTSI